MKQIAAIFLLSVLWLTVWTDRRVGPYDEGVVLTGAMRIAAGEVPHRDFYTGYGPAQIAALACLFKVCGQSVLVERAYDLLIRALIVTIFYAVVLSMTRRWLTLLLTAVIAMWMCSLGNYAYPGFPVMLFALIGSTLIVAALAGQGSRWQLFAAGVTTGLVALFRYECGFLVCVAHAVACGIWGTFSRRSRREQPWYGLALLVPYAAGAAAIFAPVAIAYLAVAPIGPFIHDIFSYPSHDYARMRSLPFPGIRACRYNPTDSVVYVPIAVCGVATFFWLGESLRRRGQRGSVGDDEVWDQRRLCCLLVFGPVAALLYLKGIVRVQPLHMSLSFVPAMVTVAALAELVRGRSRPIIVATGAILVWTVGVTLYEFRREAVICYINGGETLAVREVFERFTRAYDVPEEEKANAARLPRMNHFLLGLDLARAARFISDATKDGEHIFVGTGRTDKVFANDNIIYFATGRLPATQWSLFDPGLQTKAEIQTAIIEDLKADLVRCVVLGSEWDNVNEVNQSAASSGVHLLDDYIQQHYRVVKTFGAITVLLPTAAPPSGAVPANLSPDL